MAILQHEMAWGVSARPGRIVFQHRVPQEIAIPILSAATGHIPLSPGGGISLAALRPVDSPAGHYCLDSGREKWFLRVTRLQRKHTDLEDAVVRHLHAAGVRVNMPTVPGIGVSWRGESCLLYIYPMIAGRHFDGSDRDLVSLSETLARAHAALKSFPLSGRVRAASLATAKRLSRTHARIVHALQTDDFSVFYERAGWVRRNLGWMAVMAERFNPYLCLLPGAQPVHGDFHLGNVIFSDEDGGAVLTDFEETPDSYFPVSFDLTYLIQRFCLDGAPPEALFRRRLKIVSDAYGPLPPGLKGMMRQVCWYILMLIMDRCARREAIVPGEEYDKFRNLERLSERIFQP